MIRAFDRHLERAVTALVWVACALIPCMFTMIVVDVSIRSFGITPPLFTTAVVEYSLLYLAMLSAPWLVRQKGHVAIEALVQALPPHVREPLAKLVYLVCAVASLYFAFLGAQLFVEAVEVGNLDIRGIDMPYWLQFLPLPIGFALVGLEFLMFLAGLRHYYTYDLGEVKDSV